MSIVPLHPDTNSLSTLHDRLTLPVPAATADLIRGQIVTLADQMLRTYHEARLAENLGLPVSRLSGEVRWGAQCMDVLNDALTDAELVELIAAG